MAAMLPSLYHATFKMGSRVEEAHRAIASLLRSRGRRPSHRLLSWTTTLCELGLERQYNYRSNLPISEFWIACLLLQEITDLYVDHRG